MPHGGPPLCGSSRSEIATTSLQVETAGHPLCRSCCLGIPSAAVDQSKGPPCGRSLRTLSFGHCFDQLVASVAWPAALRHLSFGRCFNRPMGRYFFRTRCDNFCWERSSTSLWTVPLSSEVLHQMRVGDSFRQPLNRGLWSASILNMKRGATKCPTIPVPTKRNPSGWQGGCARSCRTCAVNLLGL